MAKKALVQKWSKEPKFSTRRYNRCKICGRPHGYMRKFDMCRICFREQSYAGTIPDIFFYLTVLKKMTITILKH